MAQIETPEATVPLVAQAVAAILTALLAEQEQRDKAVLAAMVLEVLAALAGAEARVVLVVTQAHQ